MQKKTPLNILQLLTINLVFGIVFAYFEIKNLLSLEQDWSKLLTSTGLATISLYIMLAIMGLIVLFLSFWNPNQLHKITKKLVGIRWFIAFVLIGFICWIYLFSPWQMTLTMPWTQFIFAASLARLLTWLFAPEQNQPFGWGELALAFSIFLYPRIVQEIRVAYPIPIFTRGVIVVGFFGLLSMLTLLYDSIGKRIGLKLKNIRPSRNRIFSWVLITLFLLAPFIYRYTIGAGGYILYPNIRFAVFLLAAVVAAYLLCVEEDNLVTFQSVAIAVGWLVLVSAITRSLLLVVNDPFSLYWSEGNRLYDYSLVFGNDLYNYDGKIQNPYDSPGRYILWGILYLWQGLPIWVHRLWNMLLLTLPSFILAWALTRKVQSEFLRQMLFLWTIAFFILLAPLHPPFMIVMTIVALFAFHPSPYMRGVSLLLASLYAGVTRWTWVFAPGAWGALIDLLLFYPKREGHWIKRLIPAVIMAMLGAVPGFLLNFNEIFGYTTGETLTGQQPLLWHRLLPNSTLGIGIILLLLFTTGPLLIFLLYKFFSRQWKLDAFQLLAISGALLGFLGVGLVISTKIGGGGDLHNVDMYIGTLILVIMLGLTEQVRGPNLNESMCHNLKHWPSWILASLVFLMLQPVYQFTPFSSSANAHAWLDLPLQTEVNDALAEIRSAVEESSAKGEILFMDQRQLLTFGYMPAIPFVSEYEKKYMMDQAMASNEAYFIPYYQDLAEKRFSLIVTEPLKVNLKTDGVFSEENDLWVIWVSAPTLCFYEPIMTDKVVGVQLLVPRIDVIDCEKYLK